MRVVVSCVNRFSNPSGLCRFTANLALCLESAKEIEEVFVVVGEWQERHFLDCFDLGGPKVNLLLAKCRNSVSSRYWWYYFGFSKLVDELRPDIVHFAFPTPFIRRSIAAPAVTTIHDLYSYDAPSTIGYPNVYINRHVLRTAVRNSDALVSISEFTHTRLNANFAKTRDYQRQEVIYQYVRSLKPLMEPHTARPSFFLSVAQHYKHKNLDIVIRAFGLLREKEIVVQDAQLYLVGGKGPDTDRLLSIISDLGLQDRVLMRWSVSDAELADLYVNCELFIAASYIEGFCLPVVEAALLSARVVCSDIPVLRESGSGYATYFSLSGDPVRNLASSMSAVLAMPRTSAKDIGNQYSLSKCRDGYVALYNKLLDRKAVQVSDKNE